MIKDFVRSTENPGAVINTDVNGLKEYKAKKAQFAKINELEKRMDGIEDMLSQILKHVKG